MGDAPVNVVAAEGPRAVFHDVQRRVWRHGLDAHMPASRRVPEETPVAFVYQGTSYAVMMATPADLGDFAVGFSLNEHVVGAPEEIEAIDTAATPDGILLRITLVDRCADAFWARRRYLAGPSGCGLCGLESLSQAAREPRRVCGGIRVSGHAIHRAMMKLPEHQVMNRLTGALHAAAFWTPDDGIVAVREDVGRHKALDKLTGAVAAAVLLAAARAGC